MKCYLNMYYDLFAYTMIIYYLLSIGRLKKKINIAYYIINNYTNTYVYYRCVYNYIL